jgi:hypothetical protein
MSVTTELEKDSKQIFGTVSQEFQTSEKQILNMLLTISASYYR